MFQIWQVSSHVMQGAPKVSNQEPWPSSQRPPNATEGQQDRLVAFTPSQKWSNQPIHARSGAIRRNMQSEVHKCHVCGAMCSSTGHLQKPLPPEVMSKQLSCKSLLIGVYMPGGEMPKKI